MAVNNETKGGYISLLPFEQIAIKVDMAVISTLTWFHAPVDTSKLRDRAADIVMQNQWLAGSLKKDAASGLWNLEYSAIPDRTAAKAVMADKRMFRELTKPREMKIDPTLHSWSEQDKILKEFYPDLLLTNAEQFGAPSRLFKVSVFPSVDGKFFGIVFSLPHSISDGHTFYKLYEALLSDKDCSFTAKRYMGTIVEQEKVFGKTEANLMGTLGFNLPMICSILLDYLLGWIWPNRFSVVSKTYVLDQNKLSKLKRQTKLPFVSTNDVVTSWFLSKTTLGGMFMNLRGRLPGHSDDMAGNYQTVVYYRSADAATPGLIRQSLKGCKRVVTSKEVMTQFEPLRKRRLHLITNWASLYPKSVDTLGVYKTYSHGPVASPNIHKTIDTSIVAMAEEEDDDDVSKEKEL